MESEKSGYGCWRTSECLRAAGLGWACEAQHLTTRRSHTTTVTHINLLPLGFTDSVQPNLHTALDAAPVFLLALIALRRGLDLALFAEPQAQPVGAAFGQATLRYAC